MSLSVREKLSLHENAYAYKIASTVSRGAWATLTQGEIDPFTLSHLQNVWAGG